MNPFAKLFRPRDKPPASGATDYMNGSPYMFFMGGSSSGKHVNERSAMQMTAVYSCVRILSEAVAGLPLHLYRYTDSGGKEKAADHLNTAGHPRHSALPLCRRNTNLW